MNEEATVVFKARTHVLSSYVKIDYRVKSSGTLIVKWTSYAIDRSSHHAPVSSVRFKNQASLLLRLSFCCSRECTVVQGCSAVP